MVIALMTSLYIFSDQIIMANLIPNFNPFENMVGPDYQRYAQYVRQLNEAGLGLELTLYSSKLIVRNAVANSAPITVLINAATLLIANGTSVNFSKMNGKLNTKGAQKV
jgi:Na+-driven multidrug efflux pump